MGRQFTFFRRTAGRSGAGAAHGLLRIWLLWERLVHIVQPLTPVPGATANVVSIRFTRYHGRPFELPDRTPISAGDALVEVHLNNARVAAITRDSYWKLAPAFKSDLGAVARALERGELPPFKALTAQTLLVSAGRLVGFWGRQRPVTWLNRLERFYFTGLLAVYTPAGTNRLARGRTAEKYPQEIWMSVDELRRRYGSRPRNGEPASGHSVPALGEEPEEFGSLP
ncbi:MAG TPA: hypothetical protein VFB58_17690 [Chloroflexota bacterium]|nr:hypothetical protein [Chloroflexota bacterium]